MKDRLHKPMTVPNINFLVDTAMPHFSENKMFETMKLPSTRKNKNINVMNVYHLRVFLSIQIFLLTFVLFTET